MEIFTAAGCQLLTKKMKILLWLVRSSTKIGGQQWTMFQVRSLLNQLQ
jgi:hypothetical protein